MPKRTRSGKLIKKLFTPRSEYIAPYKLRNYIRGNTLEDWLRLYGRKLGYERELAADTSRFIRVTKVGIEFEEKVRDYLIDKFGSDQVVKVIDSTCRLNDEAFEKTISLMAAGTRVIYQGAVVNHHNKTRGIPDFIVRSDVVSDLFTEYDYPLESLGSRFSDKWHYVIFDTKFNILELCADGLGIINDESMRYYKAQVRVYSEALARMQDYSPESAFIIGHGYTFSSKKTGKKTSTSCFARPGVVDFLGRDEFVDTAISNALSWIRSLELEGAEWSPVPRPTVAELYADFKSTKGASWEAIIHGIGKEQGDLTQLWHITSKQRALALDVGINTISDLGLDDYGTFLVEKLVLDLEVLGFKAGTKIAETLKTIVLNNRLRIFPEVPAVISTELKMEDYLYIDFEFWMNAVIEFKIPETETRHYTYLMGVWTERGEFHHFAMERLDIRSEHMMFREFLRFVNSPTNRTKKIIHWTPAEITVLKSLGERYRGLDPTICDEIDLVLARTIDLAKIFVNNNLVYPGMYNFSLKTVVKALNSARLISTCYDDLDCRCAKESEATIEKIALSEDFRDMRLHPKFAELVSYNKTDCKVLHEIVNVLRGARH